MRFIPQTKVWGFLAWIYVNKNSQSYDEKTLKNINNPLTIRVEAEQIGYRLWLLKAYLKNTWQEKITVKWTYIPCFFAVSYIVPDEEDLEIPVYIPYHGFIYQFTPYIKFFKPGEEKLVQIAVFYGVTNWANSLIADNLTKYFEDFPLLPEGDYRFEGSINCYYINPSDGQYGSIINDTVVFHLAAPKQV